MNTHVHADHVTGTGKIKSTLKECKSVLGKKSGAKADVYVDHEDKFKFGNLVSIYVIHRALNPSSFDDWFRVEL